VNAGPEVFLSAERSSFETLTRQANHIAGSPAAAILDRLPVSVAVFNANRQIIYSNESFQRMLPEEADVQLLLGQRLGEAMHCLGAKLTPGGCGLSPLCRHCGATQSMLALSQNKNQGTAEGECRLHRHDGPRTGSLDFHLQLWTLPLSGELFQAAVLTDIRAEKRLALMERIFYHDLLNLVSGLRGLCELLRQTQDQDGPRTTEIDLLVFTTERITELINAQRDFSLAEQGEYEVTSVKLRSLPLLQDLADIMRQESSARGKTLAVDIHGADVSFHSDRKLASRILVNMLKNALEATPRGATVTAGCDVERDRLCFWVRNPGQLPPEVQEQIFRRTFSTKGKGRGLGTYGMKLFAENYLEGSVDFRSGAEIGTEFRLHLPLALGCKEEAAGLSRPPMWTEGRDAGGQV
jgi:signal transduction histidine kinase